jgi:hypothetical protein
MDSTYNNEMSWVSWRTPVDDEPTRESWLLSAIDRMARSLFPAFKQPERSRPSPGRAIYPVRIQRHAARRIRPSSSAIGSAHAQAMDASGRKPEVSNSVSSGNRPNTRARGDPAARLSTASRCETSPAAYNTIFRLMARQASHTDTKRL